MSTHPSPATCLFWSIVPLDTHPYILAFCNNLFYFTNLRNILIHSTAYRYIWKWCTATTTVSSQMVLLHQPRSTTARYHQLQNNTTSCSVRPRERIQQHAQITEECLCKQQDSVPWYTNKRSRDQQWHSQPWERTALGLGPVVFEIQAALAQVALIWLEYCPLRSYFACDPLFLWCDESSSSDVTVTIGHTFNFDLDLLVLFFTTSTESLPYYSQGKISQWQLRLLAHA